MMLAPIFGMIVDNNSVEMALLNSILFPAGWENALFIIILALAVVLLIVRWVTKKSLADRALHWLPRLKQVYAKLISLELAASCAYHLNFETSVFKALGKAAGGLGDRDIQNSIARGLDAVEQGTPFNEAFFSIAGLSRYPVFSVIGLGEASGKAKEVLADFIQTLEENLEQTLDAEMRLLFNLCILACGVVVGLGLIAVFQGIIYSYNFYV